MRRFHCQNPPTPHQPAVANAVQKPFPTCRRLPPPAQQQQQDAPREHIVDLSAIQRRQMLLASVVFLQQLGLWNDQSAAAAGHRVQKVVSRSCLTLADVQSDYDRYAGGYDKLDGGSASEALGFPELRQQLVAQAAGSVLEIAVGTGLNLPFYNWSSITSFTGIDLSQGMLAEAASRVSSNPRLSSNLAGTAAAVAVHKTAVHSLHSLDRSATAVSTNADSSSSQYAAADMRPLSDSTPLPFQLLQADVTSLPFPDNSYDVVLDTFSLCVFSNPAAALSEMARVLKPGGKLLLLEHTKSDNLLLGSYQGMTRSLVAPLSKGCDWGQDVPALISQLPALNISSQQRHLAGTLVSITATKQT